MTRRAYVNKTFTPDRLERIRQTLEIVEEFTARGFVLTLRQLYYQLVARDMIPNSGRSYDVLQGDVNEARLAGLMSWDAIEDRTRNLRGYETYSGPAAVLAAARRSFRRDLWATQQVRPEVWVEKEALLDVVGQMCLRLRVDYFACRGYVSQSELWRAGQRCADYVRRGQRPMVFHLGDHDPSGVDMTRDNRERLSLFAGTPITVVRLALNMEQIRRYRPPPNPAKISDARFDAYRREHGESSWELDALDPAVIQSLIEDAICRVRDARAWDEALADEAADSQYLDDVVAEAGGEEP